MATRIFTNGEKPPPPPPGGRDPTTVAVSPLAVAHGVNPAATHRDCHRCNLRADCLTAAIQLQSLLLPACEQAVSPPPKPQPKPRNAPLQAHILTILQTHGPLAGYAITAHVQHSARATATALHRLLKKRLIACTPARTFIASTFSTT
jgi:hypothetical protein